ncbi:MAG: hypothetical protein ACI837_000994 [Crocinitomicaceae bacterium]|jgi:hypothetical protein
MTDITTDTFAGVITDDGFLLTEKGNGPMKMVLIFFGLGVVAFIVSIPLAVMGGTIGVIFAPILFWGGILIAAACIIAVTLRFAIKRDPNILFNTKTSELNIRGKVIPFSDISDITTNIQNMMGKTMVVVFLVVNGKKKSLFSTSIVSNNPGAIEDMADELKTLVTS